MKWLTTEINTHRSSGARNGATESITRRTTDTSGKAEYSTQEKPAQVVTNRQTKQAESVVTTQEQPEEKTVSTQVSGATADTTESTDNGQSATTRKVDAGMVIRFKIKLRGGLFNDNPTPL
jgi:hypothetical protein